MKITIPGKPIAKKRPRFFRKGKFVGTYNDQRTEEGRWLFEAQKQIKDLPFKGKALQVQMIFRMPIPKGTSVKRRYEMSLAKIPHTKKPDLDNLIKFVLDCLSGVAWDDDSRVCAIKAGKIYSESPETFILIQT